MGKHRSRAKSAFFTAALLVVIFATTGLWTYAVGMLFGAEQIDGLTVVHGPSDTHPTLFVTERVSHLSYVPELDTKYTTRLAVYDLETGVRISRRVIGWMKPGTLSLRPLGPTPDGLWFFDSVHGVQLISPKDGSVVRTQAQLLSADQESRRLRSGDIEDRVAYLDDKQELVVMLNDGSKLRVSADMSMGTPYTGESPQLRRQSKPGHVTIVQRAAGKVQLRHQDGEPPPTSKFAATRAAKCTLTHFSSYRVMRSPWCSPIPRAPSSCTVQASSATPHALSPACNLTPAKPSGPPNSVT